MEETEPVANQALATVEKEETSVEKISDSLKKGHSEPKRKIGTGVRAFQIGYHPKFKSCCFFVVKEDDSVDDFNFSKWD
ncbi:hypothetical protein CQW23_30362 [Capsicum baccatum]|uniref:Uncharacterized protein n=1 Tax=Capsicum baccatum TaxID=33114 RepID=A0A2G2VAQ1_CAPBA|nr:hypothetical protein CQW23_30362 [Capsicum baccatum]